MSFLMFWIMSAGGFSTCPGYQILFSMAWLVFFPMGDSFSGPGGRSQGIRG